MATIDVTITYLEMREPPFRAPARPSDSHALLRLEETPVWYYRFLYDRVGEPWLWYERRDMPERELEEIIHHPLVDIFVLYVGGVPAGFFELDRREQGQAELAYFGLMPEFIGRGYGRVLMDAALNEAFSHPVERIWLRTNNLDHPEALRFYRMASFTPCRQKKGRIVDPRTAGHV